MFLGFHACRWLVFAALLCGGAISVLGEETRIFQITPAERLALTQLDQLIASDEAAAAVDLALRVIDEADDRVALVDNGSHPLGEHFLPLSMLIHDRLLRSAGQGGSALQVYRERLDRIAKDRLDAAIALGSRESIQRWMTRYFATSSGDEGLLALADLALSDGQVDVAIAALTRIDSVWQPHADAANDQTTVAATDWGHLLSRIDADDHDSIRKLASAVAGRRGLPLGVYRGSDIPAVEVGVRLVYAFQLRGDAPLATKMAKVVEQLCGDQQVTLAGRVGPVSERLRWLQEQAETWDLLATQNHAFKLRSGAPTWTRSLPVPPRLPAMLSPYWAQRGVAEHPLSTAALVSGDKVFVHNGRGVFAWSLADAQPWPEGIGQQPIFTALDSGKPLWPTARPLNALPRFSLACQDRWLAARFGAVAEFDARSASRQARSQIVVLDLHREGALQSGYPVDAPAQSRFACPPLLSQSRLFVAVEETDEATVTTRLTCLDVPSGTPLWTSSPIAIARHRREVARAQDVVVVFDHDRLFCHIDGITAAVNAHDGRLLWLVRHKVGELADSAYPRQRMAARKSHSALRVDQQQVVVAGVEIDRLICLDTETGRQRWSTGVGVADDVELLLGTTSEHWLAAGKHLYWLDRHTGVVEAMFPAGTTGQPGAASAAPHGAGRGWLSEGRVYWPTEQDILVFEATLAAPQGSPGGPRQPRLVGRLPLQPFGLQGGNLVAADEVLINVGTRYISGFTSPGMPALPAP